MSEEERAAIAKAVAEELKRNGFLSQIENQEEFLSLYLWMKEKKRQEEDAEETKRQTVRTGITTIVVAFIGGTLFWAGKFVWEIVRHIDINAIIAGGGK